MAWSLPAEFEPESDLRLKELFHHIRVVPRTTAFHMYQIIMYDKEPILAGSMQMPRVNMVEVTSEQARYAFHMKWVPSRWMIRLSQIAAADGRTDFPEEEGEPQS